VSDVLNAGWNLQNNGEAKDFVKPYDTVNFVDGKGTKAVVESDNETSNVTFNVDTVDMTSNPNGTVENPMGGNAKQLLDDLAAAKKAVADNPDDEAAKAKLKDAEDAVNKAGGNKIATAQNVANMINNSGFTLKADKVEGGENTTDGDNANNEKLTEKGELIKPGSTVTMKAGKNMTVKHEANGNITYATKDDVEFNTVKVGNKEDGKSPVEFKTEAAKPATNNVAGKQPTTALNVTSADGNPTQITGVASSLNKAPVTTAPNVNLVDLNSPNVNSNAAATVGDLQNMGWVVSTKDGNGYIADVKNANHVDFKAGPGISVTGKTTDDGIREITIGVKDGEVVKPNQFTAKVNGVDTPVTKVGDEYYNTADIDPKTGKAKDGVNPVTPDAGTTPTNAGDGYVTGNKVATAIQKSGFVVGKQKETLSAADFKDEDEKVNPDDELRFADGNNTKVKLATKESIDKDGNKVTTTTVKVDVTGLPVQYTDKNGTPVTKVGDKYFTVDDKGNPTTTEVAPADLTTNMVNPAAAPNEIGAPTTLGNVKSNLPSVNDEDRTVTMPDGTVVDAAPENVTKAPMTAEEAADMVKNAGNNAATVSDVLNAGWNLQNNGEAKDFVKPYDTVNFVDGKGTKAVVESDNETSNVTFNVDTVDMTSNPNGTVENPMGGNAKQLLDDLAAAKKAVADNPDDEAAKAKLKDAEDAVNKAGGNKIATAQNVANMINNSGFTLKADKVEGGENTTDGDNANNEKLTEKGELIKPGSTVTMKAGKNMTVKHEANGNITYATKDDVEFNTVKVGNKEDGKSPVEFKTEAAKPATNNVAGKQPTTALNVTSADGNPTQITGVASSLNKAPVTTAPNVNLVDLNSPNVNSNAAATVGDLQNMGWVVSTKDGNGYIADVKNANHVDFKAGPGISVTGKTTDDGIREITIGVKDGEVVKPNQFTAKVNGVDTPVTKVGDEYYNTADIDPKTGKAKDGVNPVTPDAGTTPTNAGDGYVTGNKVATAIQKSGFVVGKQKETLSAADFKDEDEKVNPDDELRFADGNNTKVKLATKESIDKDGNKVTTTTVKVDVTGLPVQYTDKNGTPVTKVGDKYFTVDDKGNPTTTEVAPADLTTNMVNPAAAPNEIGAPTTLGNVKSNLPSVNDEDKNAKDVAGNPIAGKDNKSAPITATEAADLLNPKTADGKANPKFAGNNAATVSDVLNTGWNLQNNGEAKDFVKPYDTVNFVDGKGTKAVVETTPNGTTSNVKFDIDTGSITNNADGSVQGPVVTPEMTKALEDATNALNSLPPTAPAAVIDAAKKAVADAANNIANVANKVATAQDVANAINKSGFTLSTSANGGEKISGTPEMINPGKKVEMVAGKNMTVKQESNGKVTYATASNVTFDSVQFGDKGPKITNKAGNINVSGPDGKTPTKVTGVAPGEISATSKDAINGSQLYAVAAGIGHKLGDLDNKINKVGKRGDAGTASALAAANIPQAYTPGKSLVGIAAGSYQGQNGLAVGMSRISDNGKIIIRLSGTANSQGKTGVAAGVGYQW
uniref:YadA-like family protein n=1 Tax=Haemophilus sp. SZY H35 TaxID=2839967 RepID=UPI00258E382C